MSESSVPGGPVALVFPGQGSQFVGMGVALAEASEIAADVLRKADEILGISLSGLMAEGPSEELEDTFNAQPAILAVERGRARSTAGPAHRAGRAARCPVRRRALPGRIHRPGGCRIALLSRCFGTCAGTWPADEAAPESRIRVVWPRFSGSTMTQ